MDSVVDYSVPYLLFLSLILCGASTGLLVSVCVALTVWVLRWGFGGL